MEEPLRLILSGAKLIKLRIGTLIRRLGLLGRGSLIERYLVFLVFAIPLETWIDFDLIRTEGVFGGVIIILFKCVIGGLVLNAIWYAVDKNRTN